MKKHERNLLSNGNDRPDIYLETSDVDTDLIEIHFVQSNSYMTANMSINSLRRFRNLIDEFLAECDDEAICPACGYTLTDSQLHGDHRLCREYPFFEAERATQPESEAR